MKKSMLEGKALAQHAGHASQLLKTLGNPSRLAILCTLTEGEHSVGKLSGLVDLSMSALSQHLAVLKREGLVHTRRNGQTIYYSLQDHDARLLMKCLYDIYCA